MSTGQSLWGWSSLITPNLLLVKNCEPNAVGTSTSCKLTVHNHYNTNLQLCFCEVSKIGVVEFLLSFKAKHNSYTMFFQSIIYTLPHCLVQYSKVHKPYRQYDHITFVKEFFNQCQRHFNRNRNKLYFRLVTFCSLVVF